jgi:tRNA nucleotidyltransferase (CCA-adding enzyme)
MNIPKNVLNIIENLNKHRFEAYLVGGCVRDMLMSKAPADWDITTSAQPEQVKAIFKKTFDTGIEHGTVTIVMDGENYEVTTYRIDGEYKDNRRPEEVFFTTDLKEDVARRDFTVNAIAWHPNEGYRDYYNGAADIKRKIIRGVGNPDHRFKEDALRMLRAIRFACQLGFTIEEETFSALKANEELIKNISVERIRVELVKALASEYISNLNCFGRCSIMKLMLPGSENILKDLDRIIERLSRLDKQSKNYENPLEVMSLFLYDEDIIKSEKLLLYLKFDNKLIRSFKAIKPFVKDFIPAEKYAVKKIISTMDADLFVSLLEVRGAAGICDTGVRDLFDDIKKAGEPVYIKDLDIDGNILMGEVGIKGKQIGETLAYLQHKVWEKPEINIKEELVKLAKEYFSKEV